MLCNFVLLAGADVSEVQRAQFLEIFNGFMLRGEMLYIFRHFKERVLKIAVEDNNLETCCSHIELLIF